MIFIWHSMGLIIIGSSIPLGMEGGREGGRGECDHSNNVFSLRMLVATKIQNYLQMHQISKALRKGQCPAHERHKIRRHIIKTTPDGLQTNPKMMLPSMGKIGRYGVSLILVWLKYMYNCLLLVDLKLVICLYERPVLPYDSLTPITNCFSKASPFLSARTSPMALSWSFCLILENM